MHTMRIALLAAAASLGAATSLRKRALDAPAKLDPDFVYQGCYMCDPS